MSTTIDRDLLSPTNTTGSVLARALNHTAADDKDSEERWLEQYMMRIMAMIVHADIDPEMSGITKVLKWRDEANAKGKLQEFLEAMDILQKDDWTEFVWQIDVEVLPITELVLKHCLSSDTSPVKTFTYLKLQGLCTPVDKESINPRLLAWFNYIKEFRRPDRKRMSGAGTSLVVFDDKNLFEVLERDVELQIYQGDAWVAFPLSREVLLDSRKHVILLFEWLRHDPLMKSLAEDMQFYLVSQSDTKKLVLDTWMETRVSPEIVFDLMRFKNEPSRINENDPKFIAWLTYLASCWEMVPFEDLYFIGYESFLNLLSSQEITSKQQLNMLESLKFSQVLGKEPFNGFMPHADCLWTLWRIKQWLKDKETPEMVFYQLQLTNGNFAGNPVFTLLNLFIVSYRKEQDFTSEQVFDLLSSDYQIDHVESFYTPLKKFPLVGDVANGVLDYISDKPAHMLELFPSDVQPGTHFQYLVDGGMNKIKTILKRFRHVVAYYRLNERMSTEDAIETVFRGMGEMLIHKEWMVVLEELLKDSRVREVLTRRHLLQPKGYNRKRRRYESLDF